MRGVVLLLAFACLALARPGPEELAIKLGDAPSSVGIQQQRDGVWRTVCMGTIINENWVLTGALCAFDPAKKEQAENTRIIAGSVDFTEENKERQVRRVVMKIVHPKFNKDSNLSPYDIGLFKLEKPLEFNNNVNKVEIPQSAESLSGDAIVVGYSSKIHNLQKAKASLLSVNDCKKEFQKLSNKLVEIDEKTNLCTSKLPEDYIASPGDGGGPLIKDGKVIGIVSWGAHRNSGPVVYTRVDSFIDFIKQGIQ